MLFFCQEISPKTTFVWKLQLTTLLIRAFIITGFCHYVEIYIERQSRNVSFLDCKKHRLPLIHPDSANSQNRFIINSWGQSSFFILTNEIRLRLPGKQSTFSKYSTNCSLCVVHDSADSADFLNHIYSNDFIHSEKIYSQYAAWTLF